ncbi:unnamed protein product [Brassica napus]|uniref:(rape) hypothetical protein n=1 Tax=Brassica napus TaxID=3708 RepID=A0A816LUF8_BRANA|nr:unnamed protein product [Brassica napus]
MAPNLPTNSSADHCSKLVPERENSKETEASFPQAWSMIDFPNAKTSLDEAEKMFSKGSALRLVRLIDYFASAFSGVSFALEDISKDPLSSTLDTFRCRRAVLRCTQTSAMRQIGEVWDSKIKWSFSEGRSFV